MSDPWQSERGLERRTRRQRFYSVYGGVLRSSIELPELREIAARDHDWSFDHCPAPAPARASELVGEREIGREWYRLWQVAGGYRLEYSHAGTFDVDLATQTVVWYEREAAVMELVRTIVLGSAVTILLEAAGLACFHGSAIAIDSQAVVFIAPKHHGKSTFACALATRGARLISDDLVALEVSEGVTVRDGVASVRLWDDVVEALDVVGACERVLPGIKNTASGFKGHTDAPMVTPLAAVYLMSPQQVLDQPELSRTPLRGAEAAVTLAQHTKLPTDLVGLSGAATQLRLATAVSAQVPVYRLGIPDDMDLLPACVTQLLDWHAAPAQRRGGAES